MLSDDVQSVDLKEVKEMGSYYFGAKNLMKKEMNFTYLKTEIMKMEKKS